MSIIMLSSAIYNFLVNGTDHFYYEEFSILMHPSYLSMYLNVAIAWLLISFFKQKLTRTSNTFALIIITFFSFINILLSSKMGLLTMVLIYFGFLIYYVLTKKKYLFGVCGVLIIVISFFAVKKFMPEVIWRVDSAMQAVTSSSTDEKAAESTAVRMLVWKAANKIISENILFGVGTGDVKDELMKEYSKLGMTGAIEHRLNAHNAFYQAFIALGLFGFILLVVNLFFPLWHSFKISNTVYILFLLIIILNFLTESMLETQAGVVFYSFFNSLLSTRKEN